MQVTSKRALCLHLLAYEQQSPERQVKRFTRPYLGQPTPLKGAYPLWYPYNSIHQYGNGPGPDVKHVPAARGVQPLQPVSDTLLVVLNNTLIAANVMEDPGVVSTSVDFS